MRDQSFAKPHATAELYPAATAWHGYSRVKPARTIYRKNKKLKRRLIVEPRRAPDPSPLTPQTVGAGDSSPSRTDDLKPFSAEWWARENSIDTQLKKSLIICSTCLK
jgi:hypothetical protein